MKLVHEWLAMQLAYGLLNSAGIVRICDFCLVTSHERNFPMSLEFFPSIVAAADYSLIYLLGGGGIFGAVVIFILAKFLGK